jgi:hypothetical protein
MMCKGHGPKKNLEYYGKWMGNGLRSVVFCLHSRVATPTSLAASKILMYFRANVFVYMSRHVITCDYLMTTERCFAVPEKSPNRQCPLTHEDLIGGPTCNIALALRQQPDQAPVSRSCCIREVCGTIQNISDSS